MKRTLHIGLAGILTFVSLAVLIFGFPQPAAAAATLTVTTDSDAGYDASVNTTLALDMADGAGLSLREALNWAVAGDNVTFDGSLSGQTVTLSGTQLTIDKDITLDGDLDDDGTPDIAVSGNSTSRVINIPNTVTAVRLEGLNIRDGNSAGHGGGIRLFFSSATITNCTFTNNSADVGGGVQIRWIGHTSNITNCTFYGNTATFWGGGIEIEEGFSNITNCTFYGNSAGSGGGGMFQELAGGSMSDITNCVFWGDSGGEISGNSMLFSVTYSDVEGGYTGTGNIDTDPRFVDAAGGDFHLKSEQGHWTPGVWVQDAVTSPCIDAGDPASAFGNEPAPNGDRINMGSYGNTAQASKTPPPAPAPPGESAAPINYLEMNILGTRKDYIYDSYGQIQKMHDEVQFTSSDSMLAVTLFKNTKAKDSSGDLLLSFDVSLSEEPPPPPENGNIIGLPYNFEPEGATFDPPLDLTMMYDPADLPAGVSEEDLVIAYYDEDTGRWVECSCTCDPASHCITASIAHFTPFALIARQPPPAPAAFSLSDLSVQPAEVRPGETVTVTVTITNTGGMEGVYSLVLEVNGTKEAAQEISVTAGGVESASFTLSKREAGTYRLAVNGLTGSFNVVAPAPAGTAPKAPPPPAEVKSPPPPQPPATATPAPIPPAPAQMPPEPESATNWLLIGIVAAVAVAIFIFLTFRLIIRRKSD